MYYGFLKGKGDQMERLWVYNPLPAEQCNMKTREITTLVLLNEGAQQCKTLALELLNGFNALSIAGWDKWDHFSVYLDWQLSERREKVKILWTAFLISVVWLMLR